VKRQDEVFTYRNTAWQHTLSMKAVRPARAGCSRVNGDYIEFDIALNYNVALHEPRLWLWDYPHDLLAVDFERLIRPQRHGP
jgi:hypothetical protein